MANFGGGDRVCLMMGDTDAIKAYVFETTVLPEIRGGSEILLELENEVQNVLAKDFGNDASMVYCGGGGFLAIVRHERAEPIKQRIERLYLDTTTLATITVVYSEPVAFSELNNGIALPPEVRLDQLEGQGIANDLLASHFEVFASQPQARNQRKNFGEWIAQLVSQLQQAKRQKTLVPFIETLPIHRRCDSCGKRPSAVYDETRGEEICTICWEKRDLGRSKRRHYVQDFESWLRERTGRELKLEGPDSFKELAEGEGRIGVIYADGNNMGELLQRAWGVADFRSLSEALRDATKDSVFQALADALPLADGTAPLEIIALGGDDAIVVVPASKAWKVALRLVKNFEEHEKSQQMQAKFSKTSNVPVRLTMSAGVAIADEKYPIGFLLGLAEGLLKRAKRRARQTQTGTLCHLWLRAPIISESADTLLTSLYQKRLGNYICQLTARPYTWQEAERLTELTKQLNSVPKSQRRAFAEALERGLHVSLNFALYQAARHKAPYSTERPQEHYNLYSIFEQAGDLVLARYNGQAMRNWFWVEAKDQDTTQWQTALLDALELVDLQN